MLHVDGYVGAVWDPHSSLNDRDFLQHWHFRSPFRLNRFLTCARHFASFRSGSQYGTLLR
jgi:hypothetical protein